MRQNGKIFLVNSTVNAKYTDNQSQKKMQQQNQKHNINSKTKMSGPY